MPDLWDVGGGRRMTELLAQWDRHPLMRLDMDDQLRGHLRGLTADDAPAVTAQATNGCY